MFNFEIGPATQRLESAIRFRRKGGGYWYPDTLTDRHAITLAKIHFRPTKSEDDVLAQFANVAFVEFMDKPLGTPKCDACGAVLIDGHICPTCDAVAATA